MEFVKNLQSFLQSYNKSLINQACSGPYWENIGPRSFLYGPRCARSVLSRPRADNLPVRPSRLVNKIYVFNVCPLTLDLFNLEGKGKEGGAKEPPRISNFSNFNSFEGIVNKLRG